MAVFREELSCGVFYNHVQTDRFKSDYFSVNFILPLRKETAAYYALLPDVLRRGSAGYPSQAAICRRLEELYGSDIYTRNYKRGEMQIVSFAADMLNNAYRMAGDTMDIQKETIALLTDVLCAPLMSDGHFREDYVKTECVNRIAAIRARVNNKAHYALERCNALMCAKENAAVDAGGTEEDYHCLDRTRLADCYRRMLTEAHVEIFYMGQSAPEDIRPLVEPLLEGLGHTNPRPIPATNVIRAAESVRSFTEETPAVQGKLVMGFRTGCTIGEADHAALVLFEMVYGSSPASKLFMNVREKQSLCYYCSVSGDSTKGLMFVSAGIENENKEKTVTEILNQLDKIRQNEIEDDEIVCAKQSLVGNYRSLWDSAAAFEAWYLNRVINGVYTTPEEDAARIQSLSGPAIVSAAQKVSLDCIYFLRGTGEGAADNGPDEEEPS